MTGAPIYATLPLVTASREGRTGGDMSFFDYPTGGESVRSEQQEQRFLSECSEDDWSVLLAHARRCRFRAGEPVMQPEDAEQAFYLVIEGTLEAVRSEGRRRRARPLGTFATGTVIGELSFFDGRPRGALVRAVTDGVLARVGVEDLDAIALARPDLARAVLFDLGRSVAARLRESQSSATGWLG